jgi:hypothetical protein
MSHMEVVLYASCGENKITVMLVTLAFALSVKTMFVV